MLDLHILPRSKPFVLIIHFGFLLGRVGVQAKRRTKRVTGQGETKGREGTNHLSILGLLCLFRAPTH